MVLHLLICLYSVGVPTWYHTSSRAFFFIKKGRACKAAVYANKYRCYTAVLVYILYACLNTSTQFALMCTKFTRHYMWMMICIQMNPDANLLAKVSQKHRILSKSYWFTETCNSQCWLHFAAPFMVVQAETSIAENVLLFVVTCKSILQQCLTELQQLFGHAKIAAASNFRAKAKVSCLSKAYPRMSRTTSNKVHEWSVRRFAYGILITTSPSSKWKRFTRLSTAMSAPEQCCNPNYLPDHSIGRGDGRCVQRAGT